MQDSEPQRCIQKHKSLIKTGIATNQEKHIFANNLFKILCKTMEGMLFNWKICFNVINIRNYDENWSTLKKFDATL